MLKFSSNVVERGLRSEPEYAASADLIITELCVPDKVLALLHSPYGNYVIQRALTVVHPTAVRLAAVIAPHIPALRATPYGKKLERLVVSQACHTAQMVQYRDLLSVDAQQPQWPSTAAASY